MDLARAPPRILVFVALGAGLLFQLMLGTSYVGASLEPLDESPGVPVAVVVLDEGARGAELLARLQDADTPVEWHDVPTREAAIQGLLQKRYHGALVVPANFTGAVESFASDQPQAALVEVIANPGASTSGSVIASRAIDIALESVRERIRSEAIAGAQLGTTGMGALTLEQARYVAQPIHEQQTTVNAVPARGGSGLAPTYLAMAAWIGGYLGSAALERFRPQTGLKAWERLPAIMGGSLVNGALATTSLMWLGLEVVDPVTLTLFLALGTWMAYSLVSLLLDLLGLPGLVPAFAVLALGLPAAGAIYPHGLLPPFYQALHAWSPFTWLVEGLRTTLYAPAARDLAAHAWALAALAAAASAASILLESARARRAATQQATPTEGAESAD